MIKNLLVGWAAALLALIIAGAGMSATLSGSATTDPVRLSFAAVLLSGYASLVGIVLTERADRTRLRCLIWGGGIPILVAWLTMIVVAADAGPLPGIIAGAPWLAGPVLVALIGRRLPTSIRTAGSGTGWPVAEAGGPWSRNARSDRGHRAGKSTPAEKCGPGARPTDTAIDSGRETSARSPPHTREVDSGREGARARRPPAAPEVDTGRDEPPRGVWRLH